MEYTKLGRLACASINCSIGNGVGCHTAANRAARRSAALLVAGKERPAGHGSPAEVAGDLRRYRREAGLDNFQINFHGNRDLGQLLKSMECFMAEVAPVVAKAR